MDCTSQLIRKLFESESNCARTKVEAIVNNVLAPYSISLCSADLKPLIIFLYIQTNPIMMKLSFVCQFWHDIF